MGPGTIYVMVNAARYFRGPGIFQEVTGKECVTATRAMSRTFRGFISRRWIMGDVDVDTARARAGTATGRERDDR